jgi:mannose-6-phosphate isomerase
VHSRPAWADIAFARDRALSWFRAHAMPWWTDHGTDWGGGGFEERFDQTGQAIADPRRTRVTARQVYVASVASSLGWTGDCHAWLNHGLTHLQRRLRLPSGIYAANVSPDGRSIDRSFDLYEQSFALFAMACASDLVDAVARHTLEVQALETLSALQAGWGHPMSGFHENLAHTAPLRANPHMHMLEASLAWERHTGEHTSTWSRLSDDIVHLAMSRLMANEAGALTEYFDTCWEPLDGPQGQVVEPGHQFEWGWLLLRWGSARQSSRARMAGQHLIDLAEQHGICPDRGVALNALDTRMAVTDGAAKLWPQTERVKAWCERAVQSQSTSELDHALDRLRHALNGMTAYIHHPVAGLWQEVMRQDGAFTEEPCRASSFYHLVCALDALNSLR